MSHVPARPGWGAGVLGTTNAVMRHAEPRKDPSL